MKNKKLLLIFLTSLAFGTSVVITRFAISEIPPLPLVGFRLLIASVAFLVTFGFLKEKIPTNKKELGDIALVGIVGSAGPLLALTAALQFVSSGMLTVFISMSPLVTALAAHFWLPDEKLKTAKVVGLVLALSGVVFLIFTKTTGIPQVELDMRGPALALFAVGCIAFTTVYTRVRLRQVKPLVISTWQTLAGFIAVAPFVFTLSRFDIAAVSWKGWLAVTYNGVVGSFLAFWLTFTIIKRFGATASVLPTYLMPAVAGVFGALLLGEIISLPLAMAALVILFGVFLASR